jgi:hypothetical protein
MKDMVCLPDTVSKNGGLENTHTIAMECIIKEQQKQIADTVKALHKLETQFSEKEKQFSDMIRKMAHLAKSFGRCENDLKVKTEKRYELMIKKIYEVDKAIRRFSDNNVTAQITNSKQTMEVMDEWKRRENMELLEDFMKRQNLLLDLEERMQRLVLQEIYKSCEDKISQMLGMDEIDDKGEKIRHTCLVLFILFQSAMVRKCFRVKETPHPTVAYRSPTCRTALGTKRGASYCN